MVSPWGRSKCDSHRIVKESSKDLGQCTRNKISKEGRISVCYNDQYFTVVFLLTAWTLLKGKGKGGGA